ncbi:unnamed protein product [Clonostachys chloroleuca]|uniref:Uncharacterized protein n=1 Tax=Clonostachys chloroleuca TaxID=1926264 RepID=A0AA35Q5E4_9HYPO|nr:unnamed protein product [Clonostachys chloroleuca]
MAKKRTDGKSAEVLPSPVVKLPPIPKGKPRSCAKVQKRPLNRRQPPASSNSRIIYVSPSTPFMSAVKRVQKQLNAGLRTQTAAHKNASLGSRIRQLERDSASSGEKGSATVAVMGTGRAIEKTLSLASWFEQAGDYEVEMRTKTIGTVDDIVAEDDDGEDESRSQSTTTFDEEQTGD